MMRFFLYRKIWGKWDGIFVGNKSIGRSSGGERCCFVLDGVRCGYMNLEFFLRVVFF